MKIAIINTYSNGSTGSIAKFIADYAIKNNHSVKLFYGRVNTNNSDWKFIGENKISQVFSNGMTYLTGNVGSYHISSTKKLLAELEIYQPDIIHLHNLHGNYLNFKILFNYLKSFNGKVVLTLHDEFFLTGRCALFACEKWKTGCFKCKHKNEYPHVLIDRSKKLQNEKIQILKGIKNLTVVTPSNWLMNYVNESLIGFVDCRCIHNGVPETNAVDFDATSLIEKDKINILFAAFTWTIDKGAQVIKEVVEKIDKNKYNVIVAGVEKYCEKLFDFECKKTGLLSREQLFSLLKQVSIFANPTYKDNFPTILIESLKAGTPVITFNTGGCGEIVDDSCGLVINEKNSDGLLSAIESLHLYKITKEMCIKKAEKFTSDKMAKQYLNIYEEKLEGKK